MRAVVDGSGMPREVTIQPGAMRKRPEALAAAVLAALRGAHDDLHHQIAAVMQGVGLIDAPREAVMPTSTHEVARQAEQLADEVDVARRKLFGLLDRD